MALSDELSWLWIASLLLLPLAFIQTLRRRRNPLPPGPRGLPLVGNLFDVPKNQDSLWYIEMSRKYDSDIISVNLAGTTVVVLNSRTAATDLLENRSAIYSDRPPFTMLNDLVGAHWNLTFMRYGPRWKEHRKVFMRQFQPSEVLLHRPKELAAARVLLRLLLDSPHKFESHLRHMAAMVILSTAYGIDVLAENDPYVEISEKALQAMAATGNPRSYLVNSLPFLKYVPEFLPGAGFKKQAREWFSVVDSMPDLPYDFVKQARAAGTAQSSIASRVLDEMQEGVEDDIRAANELTLKNTVSALGTFILAMTLYPEVQKKAQAAIDEVVGRDRLPDFEDNIPYIDAVVHEVLRWRPVVTGAPHAVMEDDIYKGYHIPAGSIVIGNAWAILHDEAAYGPNTDQFIPERWLTVDGKINKEMPDSSPAFGFGRRICPGRDMAQWSVWISAASILSVFNIKKSLDKEGIPIEPSGEYNWGMLSYPIPHECDIIPRSKAAEEMIRAQSL
ncbi:cytochrome p450 [Favolaschia claudopus]|uniref:Cytochrome p450 n=1 Tax=Favolaschia claudopus TaxID=2862362 RepID=A0AAW0CW65_9AGAR